MRLSEASEMYLGVTQRRPHRMSVHEIQYIFKRIAKRCGLAECVSPHKMRHTLARVLLYQGAPLVAVQSILGHEKPETTQFVRTFKWCREATVLSAIFRVISVPEYGKILSRATVQDFLLFR